MASVDLAGLPVNGGAPKPLAFGGMLSPPFGGDDVLYDRPGSRWQWRVATPMMAYEPDGRLWAEAIERAQKLGARLPVRQPGLVQRGSFGTPVVSANTASGKSIPISGALPYAAILRGTWLNYVVAGQHYLDKLTAQVIVAADGTATLPIMNLLRVPLTAGGAIELNDPVLEGMIDPMEAAGGEPDEDRMTSFAFTIREAA